jgi:hypothetical protein
MCRNKFLFYCILTSRVITICKMVLRLQGELFGGFQGIFYLGFGTSIIFCILFACHRMYKRAGSRCIRVKMYCKNSLIYVYDVIICIEAMHCVGQALQYGLMNTVVHPLKIHVVSNTTECWY